MENRSNKYLITAIVVLTSFCGSLASSDSEEIKVIVERNVSVPMRDGIILRADVHRPDRGGPYPVLVQRTPYGKGGNFERFIKAGYIVVSQDVRGRYESEGKWESLFRFKTHDSEDGYDTIEWAARLPGSTGKVGTFGVSYLAFLQWRLAPLRPSSLVAMSASGIDARNMVQQMGGAVAVGGSFWPVTISPDMRRRTNRPGVHTSWEAQKLYEGGEDIKWISWPSGVKLPRDYFEDEYEPFMFLLKNPHIDPWKLDEGCKDVSVPNIEIAGWYDPGKADLALYRTIVKEGRTEIARRGSRIIIGPWVHGGVTSGRYSGMDFGPDATLDKAAVQIRWFDYWLKGKQNGVDKDAPVRIFVMGDNEWRDEQHWPLRYAGERILFLTSEGRANTPKGNGRLTEKAPQSLGIDRYEYDPRNPVPSLGDGNRQPTNRRKLADREDILVYETEPLAERIEVTGNPTVELYASSSAPDTDWYLWLIDVYPDGTAREVSVGKVRARYRDGFDEPKLTKPDEIVKYTIRMNPTSNAFLPGHRIRIDITSSDFPNYDRNHNTVADQYADATLVTAKQTIYHGAERATRIILPWVPNPIEKEKPTEEEKSKPEPEEQMHPFHQAAADGNIDQLKYLISKESDVNAKDEKERTPLHYAAETGKKEVVQLLIAAAADLNSRDKDNQTPANLAMAKGHKDVIELLISRGADVSLHLAVYIGDSAKIRSFIENKADVNAKDEKERTPLHYAVETGKKEVVTLLVEAGADVNTGGGWTPLHEAVSEDRTDLAEYLILKGANVNGGGNWTPLKQVVYGSKEMAELLIAKGANVDTGPPTPLYYAIWEDNIELTKLLLANGADIYANDRHGFTSLEHAFLTNKENIAGLLLAKISDFGLKDKRGLTALHLVAVEGYRDVAELLLTKGAKVDERDDNYEFTALHYAVRFGNKDIAEFLIANGADIKAKDKWDYQPIHWAAYHDRPNIIELLIAKGADVNAMTSLGQTPLQLAEPRRNTASIEVLRKHGAKEKLPQKEAVIE